MLLHSATNYFLVIYHQPRYLGDAVYSAEGCDKKTQISRPTSSVVCRDSGSRTVSRPTSDLVVLEKSIIRCPLSLHNRVLP